MLEKSLLYYWIHHVQLVCLVRCPLLVCISSYIIHLHQYQPMSTCLIWSGCSFKACDWLCGGLFCLSAVFPSIRGFLFGAPLPLPLGVQLLFSCTWSHTLDEGAHSCIYLHRGLFRADCCAPFLKRANIQYMKQQSIVFKHRLLFKYKQCLLTWCLESLFLFGSLNVLFIRTLLSCCQSSHCFMCTSKGNGCCKSKDEPQGRYNMICTSP